MSVHLELTARGLDVSFEGLDAFLSLKRRLHLHLGDVERASTAPQKELRARGSLGGRVGGGYWPGRFATGHFTVPGRKGARQLWCVYREPVVLVIDTRLERPARVVLQLPDPESVARRIEAARQMFAPPEDS